MTITKRLPFWSVVFEGTTHLAYCDDDNRGGRRVSTVTLCGIDTEGRRVVGKVQVTVNGETIKFVRTIRCLPCESRRLALMQAEETVRKIETSLDSGYDLPKYGGGHYRR